MRRGRCLYRLSETHRCLDEQIIRGDPQILDNFKRNYQLSIHKC